MAQEAPELVKWQGLLCTVHHLNDENKKFTIENEDLRTEVARLKEENWNQKERIDVLTNANEEIRRLENEVNNLREENASVQRHRNDLREFFEAERARLAEDQRIKADKLEGYITDLSNEVHMAWMGHRVDRVTWSNIKVRLDASLKQIGGLEAEIENLQEKIGLLIIDHSDLM